MDSMDDFSSENSDSSSSSGFLVLDGGIALSYDQVLQVLDAVRSKSYPVSGFGQESTRSSLSSVPSFISEVSMPSLRSESSSPSFSSGVSAKTFPSSDALDKIRLESLTDKSKLESQPELFIQIMEGQSLEHITVMMKKEQAELNQKNDDHIKDFLRGKLSQSDLIYKIHKTTSQFQKVVRKRRKLAVAWRKHQLLLSPEDSESQAMRTKKPVGMAGPKGVQQGQPLRGTTKNELSAMQDEIFTKENETIRMRMIQTEINHAIEGLIKNFLDGAIKKNDLQKKKYDLKNLLRKVVVTYVNVVAWRYAEATTHPNKDQLLLYLHQNKSQAGQNKLSASQEEILAEENETIGMRMLQMEGLIKNFFDGTIKENDFNARFHKLVPAHQNVAASRHRQVLLCLHQRPIPEQSAVTCLQHLIKKRVESQKVKHLSVKLEKKHVPKKAEAKDEK